MTDLTQIPDDLLAALAAEDDDVAAAVTEAAEASRLEGRLEQRILDGDDTVQAKDLADASVTGRFARLRAQRAAKKVLDERDQVRLDRLNELVGPGALEPRFAGHHQRVLNRWDAVVKAVAGLADAVADANGNLHAVITELPHLEPFPDHLQLQVDGRRAGTLRLPRLDLSLDTIDLGPLVAHAAWAATEMDQRISPTTVAEFAKAGRVNQNIERGNEVIDGMLARSGRSDQMLGAVDQVRRAAAVLGEAQ